MATLTIHKEDFGISERQSNYPKKEIDIKSKAIESFLIHSIATTSRKTHIRPSIKKVNTYTELKDMLKF